MYLYGSSFQNGEIIFSVSCSDSGSLWARCALISLSSSLSCTRTSESNSSSSSPKDQTRVDDKRLKTSLIYTYMCCLTNFGIFMLKHNFTCIKVHAYIPSISRFSWSSMLVGSQSSSSVNGGFFILCKIISWRNSGNEIWKIPSSLATCLPTSVLPDARGPSRNNLTGGGCIIRLYTCTCISNTVYSRQ